MVITPARFEDDMDKIVQSNRTQAQKTLDAIALMVDTLESLGYERGIAKFKDDDVK